MTKKWQMTSRKMAQVFQLSVLRTRKNSVSSGMFAYQIRKNWLNAMYAQNTVKDSSSLPMMWKCSVLTTPCR